MNSMLGRTFSSWNAFAEEYESYLKKTHHPIFAIRDSRTAESYNKKHRNSQIPLSCGYKYVLFDCAHGEKKKSTSSGKRLRQKIQRIDCTAYLFVTYIPSEQVFEVTDCNMNHVNKEGVRLHDVNSDLFSKYRTNVNFRGTRHLIPRVVQRRSGDETYWDRSKETKSSKDLEERVEYLIKYGAKTSECRDFFKSVSEVPISSKSLNNKKQSLEVKKRRHAVLSYENFFRQLNADEEIGQVILEEIKGATRTQEFPVTLGDQPGRISVGNKPGHITIALGTINTKETDLGTDGGSVDQIEDDESDAEMPAEPELEVPFSWQNMDDEDDEIADIQVLEDKVKEADEPDVILCNICENVIPTGNVRVVCVTCWDYDVCVSCAASGAHDQHYALRVPATATLDEARAVLQKVRQALIGENGNLLVKDDDCVVDVKKEKEEDPILVPDINDDCLELDDSCESFATPAVAVPNRGESSIETSAPSKRPVLVLDGSDKEDILWNKRARIMKLMPKNPNAQDVACVIQNNNTSIQEKKYATSIAKICQNIPTESGTQVGTTITSGPDRVTNIWTIAPGQFRNITPMGKITNITPIISGKVRNITPIKVTNLRRIAPGRVVTNTTPIVSKNITNITPVPRKVTKITPIVPLKAANVTPITPGKLTNITSLVQGKTVTNIRHIVKGRVGENTRRIITEGVVTSIRHAVPEKGGTNIRPIVKILPKVPDQVITNMRPIVSDKMVADTKPKGPEKKFTNIRPIVSDKIVADTKPKGPEKKITNIRPIVSDKMVADTKPKGPEKKIINMSPIVSDKIVADKKSEGPEKKAIQMRPVVQLVDFKYDKNITKMMGHVIPSNKKSIPENKNS